MIGIIYKATDTTNNKVYIGQTWRSLVKRRWEHANSKHNFPFSNALKSRYDKFIWEILTECKTQEELNTQEDKFIVLFDSLIPNGYNLKRGGAHGLYSEESRKKMIKSHKDRSPELELIRREKISKLHSGKKLSDEHRKKIGDSSRGIKKNFSEESLKKIGDAHRGKSGMLGKKHSDETKRKMSKAHKKFVGGSKKVLENKNGKE